MTKTPVPEAVAEIPKERGKLLGDRPRGCGDVDVYKELLDEMAPWVLFHHAIDQGDQVRNIEANFVILAHELAAEQEQAKDNRSSQDKRDDAE